MRPVVVGATPREPLGLSRAGWGIWLALTIAAVRSREVLGQSTGTGPVNVEVIPGVGFKPISYLDVDETHHKWWFWLIIGIVAAFVIVLAFFAWRGFRQWKLYKRQKQAAEAGGGECPPCEHGGQPAQAGRVQVERTMDAGSSKGGGAGAQAASSGTSKGAGEAAAAAAVVAAAVRGAPGDIELGLLPPVPGICAEPAPGEPVTAAQAAYLRERERRTAVHPRRRW